MKLTLMFVAVVATYASALADSPQPGQAPQVSQAAVKKALEYLASNQTADGYWGAGPNKESYPITLTSLAATALLMESSLPEKGTYQKQVSRAHEWLTGKSQIGGQHDGLIGDPTLPNEAARYMLGHGHALTFLSSLYPKETDPARRAKLKDVLDRGVRFAVDAQLENGGWFFTSKMDGANMDDASATVTVLFGLRSCRKVGIEVPRGAQEKANDYLHAITGPRGGLYHSSRAKPEHPYPTAAALACLYDLNAMQNDVAKNWLRFCQGTVALDAGLGPEARWHGYDVETQYYLAQVVYRLGDDGWEKLFGVSGKDKGLAWSRYRLELFDHLTRVQKADGSWRTEALGLGPVHTTAMLATVLQLEKGGSAVFGK